MTPVIEITSRGIRGRPGLGGAELWVRAGLVTSCSSRLTPVFTCLDHLQPAATGAAYWPLSILIRIVNVNCLTETSDVYRLSKANIPTDRVMMRKNFAVNVQNG